MREQLFLDLETKINRLFLDTDGDMHGVEEVRKAFEALRGTYIFATREEELRARDRHTDYDIEIPQGAQITRDLDGFWIQGWLFVPNK